LSLHESGDETIGLAGLYTYKNNQQAGTAELLPEILIAVSKTAAKEILFLGDGDTATNLDFSRSARFLAATLTPIPVKLPRLALNGPKVLTILRRAATERSLMSSRRSSRPRCQWAPKVSFVALAEVPLCLAEKQFPLR
jgi:hypothetical protein